ncbi:MAG: DnaJ domain-containing protein [Eubacteriales bacterium]|nr:DnaJ domain-containing protein [Eubacteriales bacterium]
MQDPYSVLELKKGATDEEIRHAYRQMAKRWHPDRFPAGPERMWAEQKMAQINEAHTAILSGEAGRPSVTTATETQQLQDVRRLMEIGQNNAARQALMRVESRSPEWNYLFGAVLLRLGEYDKSVLYFGIAMRQRPDNAQYRTAFASAQAVRNSQRSAPLYKRIFSGVKKAALR